MVGLAWIMSYWFNQSNKKETKAEPCVSITTWIIDPNLTNTKPTTRWRFNANGYSQRYISLVSTWREARMRELLSHYENAPDYEVRKVVARIYRVYPEALICIAYADTSLWNYLATPNNIGNVGNNDRWDRVWMRTAEAWVNAIWQTLTNRYLGKYSERRQLAGSANPDWPNYATELTQGNRSNNRYNNTLNCIGMIHNKWVSDKYSFRW